MFDSGLRSASDAAVVGAIEDLAREEARAAARRLAAITELVRRRCGDDEHAHWACDSWDAAAAEVSAVLGITRGRASDQMDLGLSLRYRLPRIAELFMDGRLTSSGLRRDRRTHRTRPRSGAARAHRLRDLAPRAELGTAVRPQARESHRRLGRPVRPRRTAPHPRPRTRPRCSRWLPRRRCGHHRDHRAGCTATDAAILDRRLKQMAHGVCDDDPRTIGQRRADALGALAAGSDRLACTCGSPECPASADDGRAASVVIHVVTDADAATIAPDPAMSGDSLHQMTSRRPRGRPRR